VRLLLDEHYSPQIAEELRNRGHEVAAVAERTDLAAIADRELLARATSERRALLTESAADSMPIVQELAASGDMHLGVVFSSPRAFPRSRWTIGLFVEKLDELLRASPAEDSLRDRVHWL